uniref:envelope membrane protein n=1 Tax=Chlamydomonas chlamydogama TaxID=225041 RepID=UPI00226D2816|nr:envelope membrane protein [Chlamydomonas chlamydogama]UZA61975.1 envelope membrane protein [Chlamydomonas chlamydogama]
MANFSKNQNFNDVNSKQDIVSITYEEIGLFPRSFSRVLDRFVKQVFSDVENLVIQEYRFYRYLFLTTFKCLLILFLVPFLVNFFAKNYLVRPLTEYFWNTKQTEIFLNSYQQKRAFAELKDFEEKLYFESLISPKIQASFQSEKSRLPITEKNDKTLQNNEFNNNGDFFNSKDNNNLLSDKLIFSSKDSLQQKPAGSIEISLDELKKVSSESSKKDAFEQRLQEKTIELASRYNDLSIEAITNFFADLISFLTLCYLLFVLEIQINITKSFLLEVFFGLDDSKKSLLILLVTDLLVGYHSSNLWELFFEFLFNHYGLPESQTGIFLLVATLPVLLDVLFKYLIFRHLNRSSPATVATYHAMIE